MSRNCDLLLLPTSPRPPHTHPVPGNPSRASARVFYFVSVIKIEVRARKYPKPNKLQGVVAAPKLFNIQVTGPSVVTSNLSSSPSTVGVATSSGPAFLSRFPRSLSQLHLKKKSAPERSSSDAQQHLSDLNNVNTIKIGPLMATPVADDNNNSSSSMDDSSSSSAAVQPERQDDVVGRSNGSGNVVPLAHIQNMFRDIPPPLPQRNPSRKSISHPDESAATVATDSQQTTNSAAFTVDSFDSSISKVMVEAAPATGAIKRAQRARPNHRTASDPEASCLQFIQSEANNFPPPLPPRQPQLVSGTQIITNQSVTDSPTDCSSSIGEHADGRPLPNSINTKLNYPLISTTQFVLDNMSGGCSNVTSIVSSPILIEFFYDFFLCFPVHTHTDGYTTVLEFFFARNLQPPLVASTRPQNRRYFECVHWVRPRESIEMTKKIF